MNASGIQPLDLKVLALPDAAVTKIGSIHVPEAIADKQKYASVRATMVAAGPNAFKEWGEGNAPTPGTRLVIAQYAGVRVKGDDEQDYVLLNDEDVVAVLEAAQ